MTIKESNVSEKAERLGNNEIGSAKLYVPNKKELQNKTSKIFKTDKKSKGSLLTTEEVSDWMKISRNALQIMRHEGKGPRYIKLSRRAVRYREQDVLEWMESATIETQN